MATVFQFDGEKEKKNTKHTHSQDYWMFTVISFTVWRWEHVYEHDRAEPGLCASQPGGLINLLCLVSNCN